MFKVKQDKNVDISSSKTAPYLKVGLWAHHVSQPWPSATQHRHHQSQRGEVGALLQLLLVSPLPPGSRARTTGAPWAVVFHPTSLWGGQLLLLLLRWSNTDMLQVLYGCKLSGWEISTFCVTFISFQGDLESKLAIGSNNKKHSVVKYT